MKVTIKAFVHVDQYDKNNYRVFSNDMSNYGEICVGPVVFEYEIPTSFNPVSAEIATLEKKIARAGDDYMRAIKPLKERIANLQCLENGASA